MQSVVSSFASLVKQVGLVLAPVVELPEPGSDSSEPVLLPGDVTPVVSSPVPISPGSLEVTSEVPEVGLVLVLAPGVELPEPVVDFFLHAPLSH